MLLQRWLRSIVALIVTQPFYINNLPYLYNQLNIINFITFCNSSMIFVHIMLFKSITSMYYTWTRTSNYFTLFEYVLRKMLCVRFKIFKVSWSDQPILEMNVFSSWSSNLNFFHVIRSHHQKWASSQWMRPTTYKTMEFFSLWRIALSSLLSASFIHAAGSLHSVL